MIRRSKEEKILQLERSIVITLLLQQFHGFLRFKSSPILYLTPAITLFRVVFGAYKTSALLECPPILFWTYEFSLL